ncbi:MAG: carboxypeptidase regulatory-like domain-containing protein [Candidatus Eremiobacteraeota bacterium]|nr:carboxypeptidase regulatory-like domain-containing protein [Candidatus Eremiobacteraeota bacterium]
MSILLLGLAIASGGVAFADDMGGAVVGTLVARDGRPAAQVDVTLDGPTALLTSRTDADGRFRFWSVLPGRYMLRITPCSATSVLSVDAGITWRLPTMSYVPYQQDVWSVCTGYQQPAALHQLTSAGTSADVYIVH